MPRQMTSRDRLRALMANPDGKLRGPGGRTACRWCGQEVKGRRRSWCSESCVDEYLVRQNQSHARRAVWKRDRGVCAQCGMDCTKMKRAIRAMSYPLRRTVMRVLGIPRYRGGTLWHADHIVPVVDGGAELGLANLRTLCLWDHRGVTATLRRTLAERRKR